MKKIIILCLLIASSIGFANSTKLSDVLHQGSQAIQRTVVGPVVGPVDQPDAHTISVTGTITSPSGKIARNFIVKAFIGKLGSAQLAGSAVSDDGGAYTIVFPSNSANTVIVKVYCMTTLLATSAPEYNVTEGVSIDLTVPNQKCEPGMSIKQKPGWPTLKIGN